MKNFLNKMLLAAVLPFVSVCTTTAQVKFGIKAGMNVHRVDICDLHQNLEASNRFGYFIGPTLDLAPGYGFGMEVSLLYANRKLDMTEYPFVEEGAEVSEEDLLPDEYQSTYHYLKLPVSFRYSTSLGKIIGAYIATGPVVSLNITDEEWDKVAQAMVKKDSGLRNTEIGWDIGAGAILLNKIRIGYNYNFILATDRHSRGGFWIWEKEHKETHTNKSRFNAHQICVTYFF